MVQLDPGSLGPVTNRLKRAQGQLTAVIRMLEASLGETGFRDGIRRYVRRYAYDNTVTDQLWSELASATNLPVIDIIDWGFGKEEHRYPVDIPRFLCSLCKAAVDQRRKLM